MFSRAAEAYNTRGGSFNGSAWYSGAGIHFHSGLPAVRSRDDTAESRRQEVTKLFRSFEPRQFAETLRERQRKRFDAASRFPFVEPEPTIPIAGAAI